MNTPHATADLLLQGRLTGHAHAAQRPLDREGHFAPALCFEVVSISGAHTIRAEQYFAPGQEAQCEAAAKALRKGMHVSFTANTAKMLIKACDALNVHAIAPAPKPQASPEADLFHAAAEQEQTA